MTHMSFGTSILLLTLAAFVSAQVPLVGRCPEVKIVDQFDVNQYLGVWYEQSKYPFFAEIGKKCIYARYTAGLNDTVNVLNVGINRLTGSDSNINGTAWPVAPGQLIVSFFESTKPSSDPNYLVLATDYQNYAVVYSCSSFTRFVHLSNVWILTREREPKAEIVKEARKVLEDNKIPTSILIDTIQNDCASQNVTLTETNVKGQAPSV